jgi:hypothetical protein
MSQYGNENDICKEFGLDKAFITRLRVVQAFNASTPFLENYFNSLTKDIQDQIKAPETVSDAEYLLGTGSTFHWPEDKGEHMRMQLAFQKKVLQKVKPSVILEVGTHTAQFDYMAKTFLPKVQVHSFGLDMWSLLFVALVNDYFSEDFITFHQGDSTQTLSQFTSDEPIDLAWVDGGHTFPVALSDLRECGQKSIPHILVDDFTLGEHGFNTEVNAAVNRFVEESVVMKSHGYREYEIAEVSADERGICYLRAKG